MNVTFADKDKNVKDGVHNEFRDVDANELKKAVNSKVDESERGTPNGFAPLDVDGKIPNHYLSDSVDIGAEDIAFVPPVDMVSTNVGDAIRELNTDKQDALGFNPESLGNKATNLSNNQSNTQYPTVKAVADSDAATLAAAKSYSDSIQANVLNYRGYWDPTGATVYPTTGGTGTAGAIDPGNTWEISVAIAEDPGVHPAYDVGALIIAKIAAPGQTAVNWGISAHNTTQATEVMRGTAMVATQAEIQDEGSSNDDDLITPKKFWYGVQRFLQVAWTFALKITFTLAPRFNSVGTNQYLKVNGTKDLIGLSQIPGGDVTYATDVAEGAIEIAELDEVKTGTDSTRAVTPQGVSARLNRLPVFEFQSDYITSANIALSGVGQLIQGDPIIAGKVVVVNAQNVPTQNGIYISDAGAWLRIGVTYNDNIYNYAGNFEGTQIFNRKDKKTYKQISTAAEITSGGQNWIEGGGSGGGSSDIFTADIIVQLSNGKTLGKYLNGETVPANGKTAVQVLQDISIEYLTPAFTSFGITGQAVNVESGDIIASGNKTFTWVTNNGINIATNSIVIRDESANTDLATGQPNDGTQLVNIPSDIHLNGDNMTQTFRVVGTKANGGIGTFFLDLIVTSFYAIFYGSVASAPSTSANVRAMTKRLRNAGNAWNLSTGTANTIFSFWLPTGVTLSSVIDLDASNTDITSSYVSSALSVNDANATPVTGTLYIMTSTVPYTSNHRHQITIL